MKSKKPTKIEQISFDLITDIIPTKHEKRYTKRKVVFLYQLKKYFKVIPK